MKLDDLQALYAYNYWANQKLFDVISNIPAEHFTQSIAGSYGSIRNTLVHILSAEWGWLGRCGGHARPGRLNPEDYPTIESLKQTWQQVETHIRMFLDTLKDEDLARDIEYKGGGGVTRTMPLGELIQHAANHAVHHRGQVTLMLRMLGHTPGNIDILFYIAEKRGVKAW